MWKADQLGARPRHRTTTRASKNLTMGSKKGVLTRGSPKDLRRVLRSEQKNQSSKNGPGLPNTPPQNSAKPLGFCRRVLRNLLHSRSLLKNPHIELQRFCRTSGTKPSFSDPANSSPRREGFLEDVSLWVLKGKSVPRKKGS